MTLLQFTRNVMQANKLECFYHFGENGNRFRSWDTVRRPRVLNDWHNWIAREIKRQRA